MAVPGSSGSPLIAYFDGAYYVVGVNSGSRPDRGGQLGIGADLTSATWRWIRDTVAGASMPAQPDYAARNFRVDDTTVFAGQALDFAWDVWNLGARHDVQTRAGIYLSTNAVISSSDTLLHQEYFARLDPRERDAESENGVRLPGNLGPGTYYLGVIVDHTNAVTESDEDNNVSNVIRITVGGGRRTGTSRDDRLAGGYADDRLDGGRGDDRIDGRAGDDVLIGGPGRDILIGGAGRDRLIGGTGFDSADYRGADAGVTVRLGGVGSRGDAQGDTYSSIERVLGSRFGDTIIGARRGEDLRGGGGNDRIRGESGNDGLDGGAGRDVLDGGAGRDNLIGGAGRDRLIGGSGFDSADYRGADAGVTVRLGGVGSRGDAQGDTYSSIERVLGSRFGDTIIGARRGEDLRGGGGNDRIRGESGNDRIRGESGNDRLDGGAGRDILIGGPGRDLMTGGDGRDRFVFNDAAESRAGRRADRIADFERGEDLVDLSDIDADETTAGNQAFDFIGRSPYSGEAGELRVQRGVIRADTDGDGRTEFQITLSRILYLGEDDILL